MEQDEAARDAGRNDSVRLAFLHIGKTGGSAIKEALKRNRELTGEKTVRVFGHGVTLPDLVEEGLKQDVCFVARDPVSRFVSGFNSRLRGGRFGTREWRQKESEAFERFATPNALAEALTAEDAVTREAAQAAIRSVGHLRKGLVTFLGSVDLLESIRDRIVFIGHLPDLTEDFEIFRSIAGLSPQAALPTDQVGAHKAPDTVDKRLSPLAAENIRRHYAKDFPIYEWCLKRRLELIAAFRAGQS